jgi:hypothetical protein
MVSGKARVDQEDNHRSTHCQSSRKDPVICSPNPARVDIQTNDPYSSLPRVQCCGEVTCLRRCWPKKIKYAAGTSIKPTLWRYRCPADGYAGGAGPSSSEGRVGGGTCSDRAPYKVVEPVLQEPVCLVRFFADAGFALEDLASVRKQ